MRRILLPGLLIALFWWMSASAPASAQGDIPTPTQASTAPAETQPPPSLPADKPGISSPQPGDELQGVVNILGMVPANGVLSINLSFSYTADTTDTWYPIPMAAQPAIDGILATWDTSTVTDGYYNLRLRISMNDGVLQRTIENLRIRNYSSLDTPTPQPSATRTETPPATQTPVPPTATIAASPTIVPTPTRLPANPATITTQSIWLSLGQGALVVLAAFTVFGLLLALSQKLRT